MTWTRTPRGKAKNPNLNSVKILFNASAPKNRFQLRIFYKTILVRSSYHRSLWDHHGIGQVCTMIPRKYVKHPTISGYSSVLI